MLKTKLDIVRPLLPEAVFYWTDKLDMRFGRTFGHINNHDYSSLKMYNYYKVGHPTTEHLRCREISIMRKSSRRPWQDWAR
jgi:hypothetical protein